MSGIRFDISGFLRGIAEAETRMRAAVELYGDTAGKKLERWAKNPPFPYRPIAVKGVQRTSGGKYKWRDITGHARNKLQSGAQWHGRKLRVYVIHYARYGVYLELAHEKKYAVLAPAVEALSPEILRGMRGLLDR